LDVNRKKQRTANGTYKKIGGSVVKRRFVPRIKFFGGRQFCAASVVRFKIAKSCSRKPLVVSVTDDNNNKINNAKFTI